MCTFSYTCTSSCKCERVNVNQSPTRHGTMHSLSSQCRAIFFNELEFRDHKKVCRNRVHSGSTDASSDSIDIEEVSSDSDSTSTESDEEDPGNQYGSTTYAEQMSTIHKGVGAIHKSASANIFHTSPSKKRPRDRRSSESNTKVKELTSSKFSSPQKAHKGRVDSGRAIGFGQTNIPEPPSGEVYPGLGGYGMRYADSEPVYCSSDSSDSEESDEGDEEYSPSEMTRLLSLNAEDMYEGGEEGEERETGGYKGQVSEWDDGGSRERRKEMGHTGAKSEGTHVHCTHVHVHVLHYIMCMGMYVCMCVLQPGKYYMYMCVTAGTWVCDLVYRYMCKLLVPT